MFRFGSKIIKIKKINDVLSAKIKQNFENIEDFFNKYGKKEILKQ